MDPILLFSDSDDDDSLAPERLEDALNDDNNNETSGSNNDERNKDHGFSNKAFDEESSDDDDDDDGNNADTDALLFAGLAGEVTTAPELNKWKEKPFFGKTTVTVGKARRMMWTQAQEEINLIKKNISDIALPADIASTVSSPTYKVYLTLFGQSSLLFNCFSRYLNMSKKDYFSFLFTFAISCKNQLSVPMMHASTEIKTDMIMELQKYTNFWNDIKNQEGNLRQQEFWQTVEDATNQQLRSLFMSADNDFPYLLGFDDDKVHYEYSNASKMGGLSAQHHVKDNRRGLTLHTCAFSATCVPTTVLFQRHGESVQDTYLRSMRNLFGIQYGGLPNLRGVTLASDRGYWEKNILFGNFLESGANIIGTMKRVSLLIVVLPNHCCRSCSYFCCCFVVVTFYRCGYFLSSLLLLFLFCRRRRHFVVVVVFLFLLSSSPSPPQFLLIVTSPVRMVPSYIQAPQECPFP